MLLGLSPRTRGSQHHIQRGTSDQGPIPADAGEPVEDDFGNEVRGAYPRGRGGAIVRSASLCPKSGLSPRTRGSPGEGVERLNFVGPIPADAGEPTLHGLAVLVEWAYPRGRGGAGWCCVAGLAYQGLSPRTRGSRVNFPLNLDRFGPIPADAGEP